MTLVDAVNGMAHLDDQPEAVKQAAVADWLLISKTDIADAEVTQALQQRLSRLNPGALMQTASRGQIAPAALFGAALRADARGADLNRWLRDDVVTREGNNAHFHKHAGDPVRSYSIYLDEPLTGMGMTAWLTALASLRGANLLRVKALLNVEGAPVAVHAVQTLIHEPIALAQWPDADRRSRLVFITRVMAREDIEATLDVLRLKPYTPGKLDPRAYAQFVSAMTKKAKAH